MPEELQNPKEKPLNMRNCMRCGIMFQYNGVGHVICPRCREIDQKEFALVRNYIYENRGATILEVSDAVGVQPPIIEGFLRAGRLEIPPDSAVFIRCERCNKEIRSGRFCAECAKQLTTELKQALDFDETQVGEDAKSTSAGTGKMRFMEDRHER